MRSTATPPVGSSTVHAGTGYELGRFYCPPGDSRWGDENWIGTDDHVVFPGPAVRIFRARTSRVATPQEVVLYNRDAVFHRALVAPAGGRGLFIALAPSLAAELAAVAGADKGRLFPVDQLPCSPSDYLLTRVLASQAGARLDPLALDEAVFALLSRVVGAANERRSITPTGRRD